MSGSVHVTSRREWRSRRPPPRARAAVLPLLLLVAGCGGGEPGPPQPAPVDLLSQANAASEIVDAALLDRHTRALLAGEQSTHYLQTELWRLGLVPAGDKGTWVQSFDDRRRVARPLGDWVLQRGEARASLGSRDFVPALGGHWEGVRLRGLPAVFVAPTLGVPAGSLTAKVVVVLDPTGTAMAAGAASPLPDLFRRAAAAGAHAVLVLPRPGLAVGRPSPARAAELAADSGLPAAAWLDEVAAGALSRVGIGAALDRLARLEWRRDLQPLLLGTFQGEVTADVEREPRRNVVALLPGRGGSDEVVAVVATLPGARAAAKAGPATTMAERAARARAAAVGVAGRVDAGAAAGEPGLAAAPEDPRARAAAAAELLAVATAFQTLSDPPRRTVLFALADPGEDGLAGTRRLLADPRWRPERVAAALVLAGGSLGASTHDVTFVGVQASPLRDLASRVAAMQERRVVGDPQPWRGLLWRSPAGAFLRAGVPAVLLEPGTMPRPAPAPLPAGPTLAAAAAPAPPPVQFPAIVEDARLSFRLALELAEGGRPPRVDPTRVETVLRQQVAPQPLATPGAQRRVPRPPASAQLPGAAGAPATPAETPVAAPSDEQAPVDAAAAAEAPAAELADAPAFVAPPPGAAPPPEPSPASPGRDRPPAPPPPTASPTPTPPRR
jgi:hypothetical protein